MIVYPNVKVNLGLAVIRKRQDGYHDLETLFVPYEGISDVLEIIPADDFGQTISHIQATYAGREGDGAPKLVQGISPDGKLMITIAGEQGIDWDPLKDLTAKAYYLLDSEYGLPAVKIFLEKRSPVGAGLGGGSADSAFALKALAALFGLSLPAATLAALAARLGSDCPFFIYNRPMIGRGRGEILTPYDLPASFFENYRLEVSVPKGITVSTAQAYRGIVPREAAVSGSDSGSFGTIGPGQEGPDNGAIPLEEILALPVEQWPGLLVNDFETTVFAEHPALAAHKKELYDRGAIYASMSGSGSAFLAIYRR